MDYIKMSKSDFIKEHEKLIKVLKSGNKKGLREELKSQSKELNKIRRK